MTSLASEKVWRGVLRGLLLLTVAANCYATCKSVTALDDLATYRFVSTRWERNWYVRSRRPPTFQQKVASFDASHFMIIVVAIATLFHDCSVFKTGASVTSNKAVKCFFAIQNIEGTFNGDIWSRSDNVYPNINQPYWWLASIFSSFIHSVGVYKIVHTQLKALNFFARSHFIGSELLVTLL